MKTILILQQGGNQKGGREFRPIELALIAEILEFTLLHFNIEIKVHSQK